MPSCSAPPLASQPGRSAAQACSARTARTVSARCAFWRAGRAARETLASGRCRVRASRCRSAVPARRLLERPWRQRDVGRTGRSCGVRAVILWLREPGCVRNADRGAGRCRGSRGWAAGCRGAAPRRRQASRAASSLRRAMRGRHGRRGWQVRAALCDAGQALRETSATARRRGWTAAGRAAALHCHQPRTPGRPQSVQ